MLHLVAIYWDTILHLAMFAFFGLAVLGLGLAHGDNNFVGRDDAQDHKRQKQGGHIFNELLWDMKGREERRIAKFARRLAAPDTSTEDRSVYAEEITTSQNQIDSIMRMLLMKDAD